MTDVQYRVEVTKRDARVDGPDAAELVFSVALAVAAAPDFDATVEFMRGRLKATGHTGQIFDLLKSGEATRALAALAAA
jgi:hypothetical protein